MHSFIICFRNLKGIVNNVLFLVNDVDDVKQSGV